MSAERLRFGVLGASWIAGRAMLDALHAAGNAVPVAIASRDVARASAMARSHSIAVVHPSYDALLADDDVDAVYIGLVNSSHREWTLRSLAAGKHVLCEKPLAISTPEARDMVAAAAAAKRTLMEAFMYRFHPRMRELRESAGELRYMHAAFSFALSDAGNYRLQPALGGGALLDVGCYTLDVARWFLGEPVTVSAALHGAPADTSVAALLSFDSGAQASAWASFAAPEHQELILVAESGVRHVTRPFTAWRDPHDPYQLMVEAFSSSVLDGAPPPHSLDDSVATARLVDRVRAAGTLGGTGA